MKKIVGAVVVVVVVVVAVILLTNNKASAPSETKKNNNSSSVTPSTPSPTPSSSTSTTDKVTISSYAFKSASLTIKKGTTVTWTNKDAVAHTVTETDGKDGPKSSELNQGQSYSFTFNTVGTFKYDCSIHPYMTGTVTVTD